MNSREDQIALGELGATLKSARERLGLSQSQVAAQAKVSKNYYAIIERGESNLTYVKLHRILKVLKIDSLKTF
ncbi:helix-turn-helix domain-containing protein [Patescibacteria group bacterium]|nr:helix-turn-helix domain-containing protein [Patescibacteria group bacterium]